ncbi:MAG TPA: hypothetical protein VGQ12_03310 [Candidatus Angelobacter sp.]|jgi:predicted nucleic acid-binding protein|nr:hypothetical protein [Candidatus Angelobacter sp.]
MAANGILFADYVANPRPKRVYCDSNFALRVLTYALFHSTPSRLSPRDVDCNQFYQQLVADKVDVIASLLTYSEVMHIYTFLLPGGMYDKARSHLGSKGVAATGSPQNIFKTLLKLFPADADSIWTTLQYRVEAVDEFFTKNIRLLSPLPSPSLSNITKSVADFASILKSAYASIESHDALHLSLATYLAADAVVSLDQAFLAVDGLTIYWIP